MDEEGFDFQEWVWEFIRQSFNKISKDYEENMKRHYLKKMIMMSEKRFTYTVDDRGFYTINDNVTGEKAVMVNDFLKWLNGLNDENEQLRQTIQEMQNDERLYANEIVKLNKEAKEVLNFKTLGGDY